MTTIENNFFSFQILLPRFPHLIIVKCEPVSRAQLRLVSFKFGLRFVFLSYNNNNNNNNNN